MTIPKFPRPAALVPAAVLAALTVCSSAARAQTVVTPTSLNGWILYDGKPGTPPSPSQITSAMPFDGNGSLQLGVTNGTQQAAAYFGLAQPVALRDLTSLGFSYYAGAGEVSAPTLRLFVSGIEGSTHTSGSFGWYGSTGTSDFTSESFDTGNGDFFFRLSGSGGGQVDNSCDATPLSQSFDDRRNEIGTWLSACDGFSGHVDLSNAVVTAIGIDYGSFPGITSPTTVYADDVFFGFSDNEGTVYNFETDGPASTVPEPASMAMLATGLVGLMGFRRRRKA